MPASQTPKDQSLVRTKVSVSAVDGCHLSFRWPQHSLDLVPTQPACQLPVLLQHRSAHLQTPEPASVPNRLPRNSTSTTITTLRLGFTSQFFKLLQVKSGLLKVDLRRNCWSKTFYTSDALSAQPCMGEKFGA